MRHKELVAAIAEKMNFSVAETENIMQKTVEILTTELLSGNTVNFQGFGSLELKKSEERITVHPATQIRMLIPPKQTVSFRQSSILKSKLKEIPTP